MSVLVPSHNLYVCVCVSYLISLLIISVSHAHQWHRHFWFILESSKWLFQIQPRILCSYNNSSGYFENMILMKTNDTFQCQLYFCYCQCFLWHRLKTPVLIVHRILIQNYVHVSGHWSIGGFWQSVCFKSFYTSFSRPMFRFDGGAVNNCFPDEAANANNGRCAPFRPGAPVYYAIARCGDYLKLAWHLWYRAGNEHSRRFKFHNWQLVGAFSWLIAPTTAFTLNNLIRHYA